MHSNRCPPSFFSARAGGFQLGGGAGGGLFGQSQTPQTGGLGGLGGGLGAAGSTSGGGLFGRQGMGLVGRCMVLVWFICCMLWDDLDSFLPLSEPYYASVCMYVYLCLSVCLSVSVCLSLSPPSPLLSSLSASLHFRGSVWRRSCHWRGARWRGARTLWPDPRISGGRRRNIRCRGRGYTRRRRRSGAVSESTK